MFGSHAVNDCRESRSSRFTLTLPHLCLHTLTLNISSCYDRVFVCIVYCRGKACIGPHFLFLEGSSLVNANSFALPFLLYSPFSAHDPTCLIWTRLQMPQLRHCAYSVLGFSSRSIKKLKTLLEHAMNAACGLSQPHLSTRLCNSSLCVSMLCFTACSKPSIPLMEPPMERPSRWRVGGESRRISYCLFCVATRVGFSATRALTLL